MDSSSKVWFISGCSTGFGRELVHALLKTHARVVATARNTDSLTALNQPLDKLLILKLDVCDGVQRKEAVSEAIKNFSRIDVLVNNAGYGVVGALEEVNESEMRAQIETNFFGLAFLTQEVLPYMRNQKSGHIINMSSIAGFDGSAGFGIYNASKFAVEGLTEALHKETAGMGIRVSLLEPGPFRTDFQGRSLKFAREIADYEATVGEKRRYFQQEHNETPGDPARAAWAMIDLVANPIPALRVPMGRIAWDRMQKKLERVSNDLKITKEIAFGTDFLD